MNLNDLTSAECHVVWRHRVDGLTVLAQDCANANMGKNCAEALDVLLLATQQAKQALHAKGVKMGVKDA
jgi:hypothetical protein